MAYEQKRGTNVAISYGFTDVAVGPYFIYRVTKFNLIYFLCCKSFINLSLILGKKKEVIPLIAKQTRFVK